MYSQDLDLLRLVAEVRAPAMVPCLCLNTVQEEGLLLVGWGGNVASPLPEQAEQKRKARALDDHPDLG